MGHALSGLRTTGGCRGSTGGPPALLVSSEMKGMSGERWHAAGLRAPCPLRVPGDMRVGLGPCEVSPGLLSSWLKTVQNNGCRPHGNHWHLDMPSRMMAQNGPFEPQCSPFSISNRSKQCKNSDAITKRVTTSFTSVRNEADLVEPT
jgi:hypothetical protein